MEEHHNGGLRLQIGAGLDGPESWLNLDASPSIRIQRLPMVGAALARSMKLPRFSDRVGHGDVVKGLNLPDGSANFVFSSHMLEHLSFEDCRVALREVLRVLQPGGVFRSVLPDLETEARRYLDSTDVDRASAFQRATLLGVAERPRGLGLVRDALGHSRHLWMWDYSSMEHQLHEAGFVDVRRAFFNDSAHAEFAEVESRERWEDAFGFECRRPLRG